MYVQVGLDLPQVNGFNEEICRTQFQGLSSDDIIVDRSEHDDTNMRRFSADLLKHFQAVHIWHFNVKQHQIQLKLVECNDRFSAADILMTHVLRDLRHTDIVADYPALAAYVARAEARPAFKRALADQMKPFRDHAPA